MNSNLIAQHIGFTRKFLQESRIVDYERLKKYSLRNKETNKQGSNF